MFRSNFPSFTSWGPTVMFSLKMNHENKSSEQRITLYCTANRPNRELRTQNTTKFQKQRAHCRIFSDKLPRNVPSLWLSQTEPGNEMYR